jgi:hypothetical protein
LTKWQYINLKSNTNWDTRWHPRGLTLIPRQGRICNAGGEKEIPRLPRVPKVGTGPLTGLRLRACVCRRGTGFRGFLDLRERSLP